MVANRRIEDATLRQRVDLQRFASHEVGAILSILEDADKELSMMLRKELAGGISADIRTKRMQALLRSVREQRHEAMVTLRGRIRSDLVDLAGVEAQKAADTVQSAIPVYLKMATVPRETLRSLVSTQPFATGPNAASTLNDWFKRLEAADAQRLTQSIQMGVVQGEPIDAIVRRVAGTRARGFQDGALSITRRNADAAVRTAVNNISNRAREDVWEQNRDIIQLLRVTATLDGRTTPVCQAADGKYILINPEAKLPPGGELLEPQSARPGFHVGCRTTTVPLVDPDLLAENLPERPEVTDSRTRREREIDFRADAKADVSAEEWSGMSVEQRRAAISAKKRDWTARNVGQVPGRTTYGEWIQRQPVELQNEVLGVRRARLMRAGELPIDRFVDKRGAKMSLAELAAREPDAFLKAGLDPEQPLAG